MNDRQEFLEYLMSQYYRDERPVKEKHYGFGLPKHYRVVDSSTGNTVTAFEHRDVAAEVACQNTEQLGQRFEVRAMWK